MGGWESFLVRLRAVGGWRVWGNGRGGGRRCIWGHAPIEECVVVVVVVDCDNSVVYGWLIVLLSMLIMLLLS